MDISLFLKSYQNDGWQIEQIQQQYRIFIPDLSLHFNLSMHMEERVIFCENTAVSKKTTPHFNAFLEHLKSSLSPDCDAFFYRPTKTGIPFEVSTSAGQSRLNQFEKLIEQYPQIEVGFDESTGQITISSEFLFFPIVYKQDSIDGKLSYISTLSDIQKEFVHISNEQYSILHRSFFIFKKRVPFSCSVLFEDSHVTFILRFDERIFLASHVSELVTHFRELLSAYLKKNRLGSLFE